MAGNVPLVGVQDLVCVLASGHRAVVKLSSKDRALVEWLCADLVKENKFSILNSQFSINVDAVIAMGSSDTMRTLGERYASVPTLLRGSRWSLAVLSGAETEVELEGLADDVLTFSGLGCRNVSFVFVPRGYDFQPLRCVLKKRETNPKHQNNLRQTKALLQLTGTPFIDCGPVVMTEGRDFSTAVSRLNYAFYDTSNEAANWIERHKNEIQCVVGRDVAFGRSQRPTLFDYPDGRDTMDFLAKL